MSGVEGNHQQQQHSYTSTYQNLPQGATLSGLPVNDRKPPSTPSRLGAYFRDVPSLPEGLLKGGGLVSPLKFQQAWLLETVSG